MSKPKLIVFTGPMFAGKSSHLVNAYNSSSFNDINQKAVFKYMLDTRYSNDSKVITHDKSTIPCIMIPKCSSILEHLTDNTREIYIDEAQFFDDIYEWFHTLIHTDIQTIYIAGLNLDATGSVFNANFNTLINNADECHELHAFCYVCNDKAQFTKLIAKTNNTNPQSNILIGGGETYQPVCKTHFTT